MNLFVPFNVSTDYRAGSATDDDRYGGWIALLNGQICSDTVVLSRVKTPRQESLPTASAVRYYVESALTKDTAKGEQQLSYRRCEDPTLSSLDYIWPTVTCKGGHNSETYLWHD